MLGLRQVGNRKHRGDFHLLCDGGGAAVQSTAKDVREAQDVVDLVRVVRAAGGDDRVVAHGFDIGRVDFRIRVGQGKNQRLGRHALDHVFLEHAAGRQTEEHVGTGNHFGQCAVRGLLHELDLVFVHQLGAAFIDHTGQIGDPDVLARNAQLHQQTQAGQRRGAGTRGHQLDFFRVFANDFQAVQNRRAHHDGGAMLVVVKDRNLHAFAQLALDIKTIGRFDVFQVDAAKSRLQRGNDLDQFVRVFFIDFDVKHIDAGELFEQNAFALHHRLAGQRANVAQAQHGRAVGHHADQITAAGVLESVGRVFDNFFAGRGHAGRISQRQVVLVDQLLGGRNGNLAGGGELVVFKSGLAQLSAFFFGLDLVGRHAVSPVEQRLARIRLAASAWFSL